MSERGGRDGRRILVGVLTVLAVVASILVLLVLTGIIAEPETVLVSILEAVWDLAP